MSHVTNNAPHAVRHTSPKPQSVEFYDKACQADFGGATGDVEVEAINGIHGINKSALTPSKKTPDKRRNHLRSAFILFDQEQVLPHNYIYL